MGILIKFEQSTSKEDLEIKLRKLFKDQVRDLEIKVVQPSNSFFCKIPLSPKVDFGDWIDDKNNFIISAEGTVGSPQVDDTCKLDYVTKATEFPDSADFSLIFKKNNREVKAKEAFCSSCELKHSDKSILEASNQIFRCVSCKEFTCYICNQHVNTNHVCKKIPRLLQINTLNALNVVTQEDEVFYPMPLKNFTILKNTKWKVASSFDNSESKVALRPRRALEKFLIHEIFYEKESSIIMDKNYAVEPFDVQSEQVPPLFLKFESHTIKLEFLPTKLYTHKELATTSVDRYRLSDNSIIQMDDTSHVQSSLVFQFQSLDDIHTTQSFLEKIQNSHEFIDTASALHYSVGKDLNLYVTTKEDFTQNCKVKRVPLRNETGEFNIYGKSLLRYSIDGTPVVNLIVRHGTFEQLFCIMANLDYDTLEESSSSILFESGRPVFEQYEKTLKSKEDLKDIFNVEKKHVENMMYVAKTRKQLDLFFVNTRESISYLMKTITKMKDDADEKRALQNIFAFYMKFLYLQNPLQIRDPRTNYAISVQSVTLLSSFVLFEEVDDDCVHLYETDEKTTLEWILPNQIDTLKRKILQSSGASKNARDHKFLTFDKALLVLLSEMKGTSSQHVEKLSFEIVNSEQNHYSTLYRDRNNRKYYRAVNIHSMCDKLHKMNNIMIANKTSRDKKGDLIQKLVSIINE